MANVNIKFNGKEYLLSCENGQEDQLEELSIHLNKKFNELKKSLGNIGENKLLLISSISVMDEYFETKKKIDEQKDTIINITDKFKELKKLVYKYKDEKENEISKAFCSNDGSQVTCPVEPTSSASALRRLLYASRVGRSRALRLAFKHLVR